MSRRQPCTRSRTRTPVLNEPAEVAQWAEHARLARGARVTPAGFRRAIAVREALYRIFVALAHGRRPRRDDLELVHGAHARAFRHARHGSDLRLEVPASTGVEAILWPVLESARELLADPSRIKECEGEECGWVFVDATKSGTRRWCSMASCGARAKMKRYRARPQRSRSS
jgi:predicted RNA-binding Zn ribbon-like protein